MTVLPVDVMFKQLEIATISDSTENVKKILRCLEVVFNSDQGFELLSRDASLESMKVGLSHSMADVRLQTLNQLKSKFIQSEDITKRKFLVSNYMMENNLHTFITFVIA